MSITTVVSRLAASFSVNPHGSSNHSQTLSVNPHGPADHSNRTLSWFVDANTFVLHTGIATAEVDATGRYFARPLSDSANTALTFNTQVPHDWASGVITVQFLFYMKSANVSKKARL